MTSCPVRSASNPRVTVKSRKSGLRRNRRMERSRPLCSTETAGHTFEHDDTSACHAPPAGCRARGVPARARLHGHVRHVRPGRRTREHRDHSCSARRRHHAAGHRRLLRRRPQRDADRPGAEGPADKALLSVKFGALRGPDGAWLGMDLRPAAVKNFLAYSLRGSAPTISTSTGRAGSIPRCPSRRPSGHRGTDQGRLRALHRAVGSRRRHASGARTRCIRIADLQIEYSLISRGPEAKIFPALTELGIGVTAYGVLSRGLLTGSRPTRPGDFRGHLPRFAGDNLARNQGVVEPCGRSPQKQVAQPHSLLSRGCWRRATASCP